MLAIIAGYGKLPEILAQFCKENKRPYHIFELHSFTKRWQNHPHTSIKLDQLGLLLKNLQALDCNEICLAGSLNRPKIWHLRPDFLGCKILFQIIWKFLKGDDALLRAVTYPFEKRGFTFIGAHHIMPQLLIKQGYMSETTHSQHYDFTKARAAAKQIGMQDKGQAILWGKGGLIAVEDAKGTDFLISKAIGHQDVFLYKCPKPQQDWRFDLPTIGVQTIVNAAESGLIGIVAQAEGCLLIESEKAIEKARRHGIFIYGDKT